MSLAIYIVISVCVIFWVWWKKEHFSLNSDSLQKQWLFRLAILFPLMSSLYFMIWLGSSYPFRWDAIGYNGFLEINKFSLGILALSPILGAFIVYMHRSLQSETQIKTSEMQLKEAQKKNKVDIYYATRKGVYEQLGYICDFENEKIQQIISIYNKAYIVKNMHEDAINPKFNNLLDEFIGDFHSKINDFISVDRYSFFIDKSFSNLPQFMHNTSLILSISSSYIRIKSFFYFKTNERVQNLYNEYPDKFHAIRSEPEFIMDEGNNRNLYVELISEFRNCANDIINVTIEIFIALYPGEKIELTLKNLNKLYGIRDKLDSIINEDYGMYSIKDNGDKLAAENQNPPK
ncbi:hypothetical protein [Providencia rettgeri]|uniref:hypothetical protein n=1 Tax=Providencia rettgeri TaxID=587 RepID=UPI001BA8BA54|nr:hypothetical protein [Providencia rettgeri]MBS0859917.1 hypothetical protein [Providencia rettgeri]MBS0873911.1 hypothetical protein [Providencia rettgeri]MBS0920966.1 hypothetical protein [Providencia rettgeri]